MSPVFFLLLGRDPLRKRRTKESLQEDTQEVSYDLKCGITSRSSDAPLQRRLTSSLVCASWAFPIAVQRTDGNRVLSALNVKNRCLSLVHTHGDQAQRKGHHRRRAETEETGTTGPLSLLLFFERKGERRDTLRRRDSPGAHRGVAKGKAPRYTLRSHLSPWLGRQGRRRTGSVAVEFISQ